MRNKIIPLILIATMVMPITEGLAFSGEKIKTLNTQRALAQEVFIDGLYDNSTLYIGADIKAKGYVNKEATQKEIEWQVTGNNGIIDFTSTGGNANIIARKSGTAWVMARATDGSYSAREYAVNVKPYPTDGGSQALIGENITPVLKRPFNGSDSILRVEVNKKLSLKNKEANLEKYLRKLAASGKLTNKGTHQDDNYQYFILNTNSKNIEVRVDKKDSSYNALKNILSDVSKYNGGQAPPNSGETDINPPSGDNGNNTPSQGGGSGSQNEGGQKPSTGGNSGTSKPSEGGAATTSPSGNETNSSNGQSGNSSIQDNNSETNDSTIGGAVRPQIGMNNSGIEKEEVTQGVDNIIIQGGTGSSEENPIIVTVDENLSSFEKIATMNEYMKILKSRRNLSFVRSFEENSYMSYVFKVSESMEYAMRNLSTSNEERVTKKNDFFIEIRVDKNDKEAYAPIIEMLENEAEEMNKTVLGKNESEQEVNEETPLNEKKERNLVFLSFVGILAFGIALKRFIGR
ncbi:MAG: hypothetical protein ACRC2K_10110 [Clostridium sp.]